MPKPVFPPQMRLHKPSGRARVRWLGREYYLGPFGSAEAAVRYGEWVAEHTPAPGATRAPAPATTGQAPAGPGYPTLGQALARWEAEEGPRFDPEGGSVGQYLRAFRPVLALYGMRSTSAFGLNELKAVRDEMRRLDWSARVVNRRVVRVRTVWRWFEEVGLAPPGSWGALQVLKPVPPGDRRYRHLPPLAPIDPGQYELLLLGCHPLLAAMVEVHYWSGMRSGELASMRAGDVEREGEVWLYRPRKHKNQWRGHDRLVLLGPRCQAALAPWLDGKSRDEWAFPCHRGAKRTDRPWSWALRRRGPSRYSVESYAQAFARACEGVGLPPYRPYQLRHSAKERITREHGLDVARAVLGDRSIEAAGRYASQRDMQTAREAASRLG